MGETARTIEVEEGEQAKVASWRLHVLIEAGYPVPLAERLAPRRQVEAVLAVRAVLLAGHDDADAPALAAEITLTRNKGTNLQTKYEPLFSFLFG